MDGCALQLERTTRYEDGFDKNHKVIKNFWAVMHELTLQQKQKVSGLRGSETVVEVVALALLPGCTFWVTVVVNAGTDVPIGTISACATFMLMTLAGSVRLRITMTTTTMATATIAALPSDDPTYIQVVASPPSPSDPPMEPSWFPIG